MIWLAILAMALIALGVPLLALRRRPPADDRRARDLAVYKRQLAELEDESARGVIGAQEAEAARLEIERRILRLADEAPIVGGRTAPPWAVSGLLAIAVLLALPLYLTLGRPDIASQPPPQAAARQSADDTHGGPDMARLVDRLAEEMEANPDRLDGWQLLGRSALNTGRPRLAVYAFDRARALAPDDPYLLSLYGEALVGLADGNVTPAARLVFRRTLEADPENVGARYYTGLAHLQDGAPRAARTVWQAILDGSPPDAPWRPAIAQQIAAIDARSTPAARTGPSEEDMAAAAEMSPEEREAMIRSMVAGLAEKLEESPEDYQGWLRLARAYRVLGDESGEKDALRRARQAAPAEMRDEIDRQLGTSED